MSTHKKAIRYLVKERGVSPKNITSALLAGQRRGEVLIRIEAIKHLMEKHDIRFERLLLVPKQELKKLFEKKTT